MSHMLEIFSSDMLQDDFVKCFSPLLFVQILFGTNRVEMKDRFVTNTTPSQKIYSCFFCLFVTSSALYFDFFYKNFLKDYMVLYILYSNGIFLQFACYSLNVIQVKFFRQENNLKLYLLLQKIDRNLGLDEHTFLNKRQYIINAIAVSTLTVGYLGGFLIHVYSNVEKPVYTLFLGLGMISVYVEILVMESQIYFVATRLRFLNNLINVHLNNKKTFKQVDKNWFLKQIWPFDDKFREIASGVTFRNKNETFNKITSSMKCIIDAFNVISYIYSFQVMILVGVVFIWTLLVIEGLVLGFGTKWMPLGTAVTMILFLLYYGFEIILMAANIELFLIQLRTTKSLCSGILINNCEGDIHDTAKALLRMIEWYSPEFSVYGIFVVGKELPLRLLRLITTNVIVMMQFTFL